MSELSRTIIAGTQQIQNASRDLLRAKADKRQRKTVALKDLGSSVRGLGETWKKHGDWQRAKADEDGTRAVDDAFGLGMADSGSEGALVALNSVDVRTPGAARRRADLIEKMGKATRDATVTELDEAQAENYRSIARDRDSRANEEQERRVALSAALAAHPLPKDATEEEQRIYFAMAGGAYPIKEGVKRLGQLSSERRANAGIESREKIAGKQIESREGIAAAKQAGYDARTDHYGKQEEGRNARLQSQLDATKSNKDNAIAANERIARLRVWMDTQRLGLAYNIEARRRAEIDIKADLSRIRNLDMKIANAAVWADEDIGMLKDSLRAEEDAVQGALDDLKNMHTPSLKLPPSGSAPAPAQEAHPSGLTTEQVSQAEKLGYKWNASSGKFEK